MESKQRPVWRLGAAVAGIAAAMVGTALLTACGGAAEGPTPVRPGGDGGTGALQLNGAGATFPFPLYSKWFDEYARVNPDVRINYQSIGSGGGIKQITEGTVDFGASDAPMTDEQLAAAPGILHVPTVLGAVTVTYHLEGVDKGLKLSPEVLAGIYLGEITRWNDPAIAADNPERSLPDRPIAVVHRSDGSGTTHIFTDYLSTVSPEWKEKVGKGTSVNWPVGLGAKGNEGVAGQVKQVEGAIGYIELAYAEQNGLTYARLRNREGEWVLPTIEATSAAAAGAAGTLPEDFRVSIVDAPGPGAYPIAAFTYILLHREQPDERKGKALAEFLWWAVHEGEDHARELLYAPLPEPVVEKVEESLRTIAFQGRPLLPR